VPVESFKGGVLVDVWSEERLAQLGRFVLVVETRCAAPPVDELGLAAARVLAAYVAGEAPPPEAATGT
jgi:hypothetical protein